MANTACTVKHITLTTIIGGSKYVGGIDKDGIELADVQMVADTGANKREYHCSNCNKNFDGSETFDEVKKHFGTFPLT